MIQKIFLNQPTPTKDTKDFRIGTIIYTEDMTKWELKNFAENGDAVWVDPFALVSDEDKEDLANKKTTLTDSDTDYPTTRAVKNELALKTSKAENETIPGIYVFPNGVKIAKVITLADTSTSFQLMKSDGVTVVMNYNGVVNSFTFGSSNTATGTNSKSWGNNNQATGASSTAIGAYNVTSGTNSFASGFNNVASAFYTFVFGSNNVCNSTYSTAFGFTNTASGSYTTAWGLNNVAQSFASTVFGRFNANRSGSVGSWVATEILLDIGNGADINNLSSAFTVFKNGTSVSQSSHKVGNDSASASVANVGAIRYRANANNSYCEQCMQTGASTYAWVELKKNTW